MDTESILRRADALFDADRAEDAVRFMEESLTEAEAEGDWQTRLALLNEVMGYYRSTGRLERAGTLAEQALDILAAHELEQTLAGATTRLNVATLRRAEGRPGEALSLYRQVELVYRQQGLSRDIRLGGLYNNMAVASLETGRRADAVSFSRAALQALPDSGEAAGERASVLTTLAAALLQGGPSGEDEAEACLDQALSLYENEAAGDPHQGAALAARGALHYRRGRLDQALACYEQAWELNRRVFGENRDSATLERTVQALRRLTGREPGKENHD
ncbi:MAG: tetratricopeptide repeat protein [Firmicutes bacterium]|nr:tetratricopeptide repeat protein [Bacillota bacterium]